PFSSGFSRIPLMQWAAPEYRSEQGKIQSLSQQMEKLRQHYRKVEKQDIPASQTAFEKQWQQWGNPALQLSEPSCLNVKMNYAGRSWRIQNVVARSDERNSSGKMTMPLWIQGC
ncbi:hypothetical protein PRZ51_26845, partial [Escherichia coli]|nr:hypothetical protein [Escherichia coli]